MHANHFSNTVILLCINVFDSIIDKKLAQVKPISYPTFFPMKHEKLLTNTN